MCVEKSLNRFGGGARRVRRNRGAKKGFACFSLCGARAQNRWRLFLCNAFAELCARFCGRAWCVRRGVFDHARFLRGALAAQVPGRLLDAVLRRLAAEHRGCGCGVGTALSNHTPLSSGTAECAAFSPARRLGPCVCLWLGEERLLRAPVRTLWWEVMARAGAQAAYRACQPSTPAWSQGKACRRLHLPRVLR